MIVVNVSILFGNITIFYILPFYFIKFKATKQARVLIGIER